MPKKIRARNIAQILNEKTPNIIQIKENIIKEEINLNDFNFNININIYFSITII
jgi:hypothetical protein